MSRIIKMKETPPEEMNIEDHEMAIKIRQKAQYTNELNALNTWVLSQADKIVDGKILPSTKMIPVNGTVENPIPADLRSFFEYILEEYRIPRKEVRAFQVQCIKPMEPYSSKIKKENKEVTIKQCLANTSDRFVFFGGSKELLRYKIINIDQLRKAAKLPPNAYIPREFTEQVAQNSIIHMDLVTAISNMLVVDNLPFYMRPKKSGFRDGFKIQKNPNKRWIVVLDVIATAEKFDTVLAEKLEMIGHIIGNKPDSKEAKVIQSFASAQKSEPASSISSVENDSEAPLLVELKEEKCGSSDEDEDVEDVEMPSNLNRTNDLDIVITQTEDVDQDVLDGL